MALFSLYKVDSRPALRLPSLIVSHFPIVQQDGTLWTQIPLLGYTRLDAREFVLLHNVSKMRSTGLTA